MRPVVTFPPAAYPVKNYLAAQLATYDTGPGPAPTVDLDLPADWTRDSATHVLIAGDGVPEHHHPVAQHATVRGTVWAAGRARAEMIAVLCIGILDAYSGGDVIAAIRRLTGPIPAWDPDHEAHLSTFTVRATVLAVPVTPGS